MIIFLQHRTESRKHVYSDAAGTGGSFPDTFSVHEQRPAELEHVSDVTGQPPAGLKSHTLPVRLPEQTHSLQKQVSTLNQRRRLGTCASCCAAAVVPRIPGDSRTCPWRWARTYGRSPWKPQSCAPAGSSAAWSPATGWTCRPISASWRRTGWGWTATAATSSQKTAKYGAENIWLWYLDMNHKSVATKLRWFGFNVSVWLSFVNKTSDSTDVF